MKQVKRILFVGTIISLFIAVFAGFWTFKYYYLQGGNPLRAVPTVPDNNDYETLDARAEKALAFATRHGLSQKYCFLVDFSIPSGTPRFYVWDYEQGRVVGSTYCMHGPGGGSTSKTPVFSNRPGSNCSALGRFAVTKLHGNKLKRAFRVRGLDISNQSAFARGILIHQARWVDINCWHKYIPLNSRSCQGCFTVSTRGFDYLEKLINSEQKQILIWSFA